LLVVGGEVAPAVSSDQGEPIVHARVNLAACLVGHVLELLKDHVVVPGAGIRGIRNAPQHLGGKRRLRDQCARRIHDTRSGIANIH
jgi:hypothetical protein